MRYFSILFVLMICFSACNRKTTLPITIRPEQLPKADNRTDINIQNPELKEIPLEKVELIYYGKTSCYGQCPVFFIQFFSDGSVVYNGIKNVDKLGQIKTKIPVEQLFEMINQLDQEKFFSLASSYPVNGQNITELPNTIIRINNRATIHTVNHNYDAPNAFYEVENRILGFLDNNFITE